MNKDFANDIIKGLSDDIKHIPSKYFYDENGSVLFSRIMQLPEYYLTNAELEIFKEQSKEVINQLKVEKETMFELIELGAGDGYKTIELLKVLEREGFKYQYIPIDISQKALNQIKFTIANELPNTIIYPKKGDYFHTLNQLKNSSHPKVILFLGSNIGNMLDSQAKVFLKSLALNLNTGDKMVLGVDIIKPKEVVLPAYNDKDGVTSAFNLNLLLRINNEFEANFDLSKFRHSPEYDDVSGIAKSSIESIEEQEVFIPLLDLKVQFKQGEKIHTEISRKYNDAILAKICEDNDWIIQEKFIDSRRYFANYILEKT